MGCSTYVLVLYCVTVGLLTRLGVLVFQFADVNAFLTLAATRHKIRTEELREKPRVQEILNAAKEGKVPAYLVSSTSSHRDSFRKRN